MRLALSGHPSKLRLRALGGVFLGLLALGGFMTYAVFDKTFVDVVRTPAHVSDIATLLVGPLARGTEVSLR